MEQQFWRIADVLLIYNGCRIHLQELEKENKSGTDYKSWII
jgi:hypothetical protein